MQTKTNPNNEYALTALLLFVTIFFAAAEWLLRVLAWAVGIGIALAIAYGLYNLAMVFA